MRHSQSSSNLSYKETVRSLFHSYIVEKKQTQYFHPFPDCSVPCPQSSLTYFRTSVFDLELLSLISPNPGAFVFWLLNYRTQDSFTELSKEGKVLMNHRTDHTPISSVTTCIFNLLLHTFYSQ